MLCLVLSVLSTSTLAWTYLQNLKRTFSNTKTGPVLPRIVRGWPAKRAYATPVNEAPNRDSMALCRHRREERSKDWRRRSNCTNKDKEGKAEGEKRWMEDGPAVSWLNRLGEARQTVTPCRFVHRHSYVWRFQPAQFTQTRHIHRHSLCPCQKSPVLIRAERGWKQ